MIFVCKFPNFRYHGNRGWSDTNFSHTVKSADPENLQFGAEMRFMTYVGTGSAAKHLSGNRRMASMMSSADTEVNVRSETPERTLEKLGYGAPSVAALILATLSEKS